MPLEVGVESCGGIEFRGIGWEPMNAHAIALSLQGKPRLAGAVSPQAIPEQHDGAGGCAQQVAYESHDVGAFNRPPHLMEPDMGVGSDGCDGGEFGPADTMLEDRGTALGRPGLGQAGNEGEPALVEKHHQGTSSAGFFLRRGQL